MAKRLPPLPPIPRKMAPPTADFVSGGEAAGVEVSASGLTSLEANIRSLGSVAMEAAGREMELIMSEVIKDAQDNYVPWDTRDLIDSGDWDQYDQIGRVTNPTIVEIKGWFGSPLTELAAHQAMVLGRTQGLFVHDPNKYALAQHEGIDPASGKPYVNYTHGGGPKYLELPFTKIVPTIAPRIMLAVNKALGGDSFGDLGNIENSLRSQPAYPGYGSNGT